MCEVVDLGPATRIPLGEGRTFDIGAHKVAVFRTRQGEVFATQATCPHRGGPIADGLMGGRTVVCPLHAFKFDVATGSPVGHTCGGLTTYPVSIDADGRIRLELLERSKPDR
jgi:nitrite reductase (NADH) small subunit